MKYTRRPQINMLPLQSLYVRTTFYSFREFLICLFSLHQISVVGKKLLGIVLMNLIDFICIVYVNLLILTHLKSFVGLFFKLAIVFLLLKKVLVVKINCFIN